MYDGMPQSGISQLLAQMMQQNMGAPQLGGGMGGVSMPIAHPMAPSFQMPQIQGANPSGNSPHFATMPAPQPPAQDASGGMGGMSGLGGSLPMMAMMQAMGGNKEPAMTGASASLPSGMPGIPNIALNAAMPTLQHQNMLQHLFNGGLSGLFGG